MTEIFIGTAGWSIPAAVADRFPGEGQHLERYARVMNAAEINSSFHRPHQARTYARWAEATPPDFRFSVKVPKSLTHENRLAEPNAVLDRFAGEVAGLGDKLAVLLVQTPPNLGFEPDVAEVFFAAMQKRFDVPVALEPRHPTWFTAQTDAWLAERRIARVGADPARLPEAASPGGWDGLAYFRLHGSPRIYYSAYAPEVLEALAAQLRTLGERGPVWCVLDNTAGSAALGDALTVKAALGHER